MATFSANDAPPIDTHDSSAYPYSDAALNPSHAYLLPALTKILDGLNLERMRKRIFEVGCGNGAVAGELKRNGFDVVGVDPSEQGIARANERDPQLKLSRGSINDDLALQYGQFPVVISLEVVEHVFLPRTFASTLYALAEPGGIAIVSTPYHGYWKNLALAVTGRMDDHFTALWDYGHIKFWSERTLRILLEEAGFREISFTRVGRIPVFAKSMIAIARK